MAICHPDNAIFPTADGGPPALPETPTPEQLHEALLWEVALGQAWTTLQALSAYQIAICPVMVRPCKASCAGGSYRSAPAGGEAGPFWPLVSGGVWTNVWCGHRGGCACREVQEVWLPGTVGDVVEVRLDGEALLASAYRVDNGNRLVRQDGGSWPMCQDMNKPAGEDGTFDVTYYSGATADVTVRWAAGKLATEFYAAATDGECHLPAGTIGLVRQGVQIEVTASMFEDGKTGLPDVDQVISRFNPYGARMPSVIFSLDRKPARQTTLGL